MEESKNLQGLYTAFRIAIYVSLVAEVFEYAIPPGLLEPLGSWLVDIQERMGRWFIYQQGHHNRVYDYIIRQVDTRGG